MEKIFNKLVRDNIPEIIKSKNETPYIRILSDNEYKRELFRKLTEECNEVISTSKKDELLEELADVLEVIKALSKTENESLEKIIELAEEKAKIKGAFNSKIFLEKTSD